MAESISLPIADIQKRIMSFVIDDIVISVFFIIIFYDQISLLFSNSGMNQTLHDKFSNCVVTDA
ncbi:MAG: hypothetical protein P794_04675 [Epsilonproteobacteria bacterium (ex Lamellibrachia satsuma)]|nr:MAG: hypothetical protein P794_04675 [Epsilonproteobacteria bacterium (ex Lamellibrachia satsuma)]